MGGVHPTGCSRGTRLAQRVVTSMSRGSGEGQKLELQLSTDSLSQTVSWSSDVLLMASLRNQWTQQETPVPKDDSSEGCSRPVGGENRYRPKTKLVGKDEVIPENK